MDDVEAVLRCSGCGLPVGLTDDVANLAGRRFHRMCVDAPHADPTGRPEGRMERLRGWVNLGSRRCS